MRQAEIKRTTGETDISLSLSLDGKGSYRVSTGVGFFNHMLALFARHGLFDLTLSARGDLDVDAHHTVEDVGICLGAAFKDALGDKRGIRRYGHVILPMDEALVLCAVDISGRGYLNFDVGLPSRRVGAFDTELVEEFFSAFAREAGITLHLQSLAGGNTHHIIEACFKAFGRVMRQATEADARAADAIPSTKGTLS